MPGRQLLIAAGLGLATVLAGCGATIDPLAPPAPASSARAEAAVVVGSAASTESTVVAELYSQALRARGVASSTRLRLGSREVYLRALRSGSVSLVPEYTGDLLLSYDPNTTATTAAEVERALPGALPTGFALGSPSAARNQDVYVVTRERARTNGLTSLADLERLGAVTLGGPAELEQQPYGPQGLEQVYGVKLERFEPADSPAARSRDLDDGTIEVGEFLSTEPVVLDRHYVALEDPQALIRPQNLVPLMRAEVAGNAAAVAAIDAVQQALTTKELTALDKSVQVDGRGVDQVASEWLTSQGLG